MVKTEKKIDGSRKQKRVTKKKKSTEPVTKRHRLKKTPKAKKEGGQPENKNAEKWTEKKLLKMGHGLINWMKEKSINVFIDEYFLFQCDFNPTHLSRYTKKYESFGDLIKKAKKIQELRLVKHCKQIGIPMSIFFLKANHGYKDKIDITTNDKSINEKLPDLSHLGIEQLRKLHGELNKQGD